MDEKWFHSGLQKANPDMTTQGDALVKRLGLEILIDQMLLDELQTLDLDGVDREAFLDSPLGVVTKDVIVNTLEQVWELGTW